MEKIIEIDITNKDDLLEKYNQKIVSHDLINHVVNSVSFFRKNDQFKIIVNSSLKENYDYNFMIKEGLKREYDKNLLSNYRNNFVQLLYLFLGIGIIFLSTLINDNVFKEIILIGGWVFIWAMVELEITDNRGRQKRKILKKLLNSQIIIKV